MSDEKAAARCWECGLMTVEEKAAAPERKVETTDDRLKAIRRRHAANGVHYIRGIVRRALTPGA